MFSAGHTHQHPTKGAADRYLAHGVPVANFFRTDRGDDEAGGLEWKEGSITGCMDKKGDDDVEILLETGVPPVVRYRLPQNGC